MMEVRAVAIEDQKVQAVFEVYAILSLGTLTGVGTFP